MPAPTIELDHDALVPGDELSGRVSWELDEAPDSGTLRVYWTTVRESPTREDTIHDVSVQSLAPARTQSRGGFYRADVIEDRRDGLEASDSRRFALAMPASPYSFSGRAFGLEWRVAITLEPGGETSEVEVILSPSGQVLALHPGD